MRPVMRGPVVLCVMVVGLMTPVAGQTGATSLLLAPSSKETHIQVYADGAIRGATLGEEGAASGTGSLGIRVRRAGTSYFARINVASTIDTVSEGYGSVILSPANGGGFRSGVLDMERRTGVLARLATRLLSDNSGAHTYLTAASSTWAVEDGATEAVIFGGGLLLFKDLANGYIEDPANRVRVKVEIGPSFRSLAGALRSGSAAATRRDLLGSPSTWFAGLELGLQVEFGVVAGALQVYLYDDLWEDTSARGVTGGQLVALFSIGGPVFSGVLK